MSNDEVIHDFTIKYPDLTSRKGYNDGMVHHIHHSEPTTPHISVKAEKNSKGVNWEVSVSGCKSVFEAMDLLDTATADMEKRLGGAATSG